MRFTRIAVLVAGLSIAGAARADSTISGIAPDHSTAGAEGSGRSSPIAGKYMDNAGPLAAGQTMPGETGSARSSPTSGNCVADSTVPSASTPDARRPTEQAPYMTLSAP